MSSMQPNSPQNTVQVIIGSDYLHRQEERKHRWAVRLVIPVTGFWLTSIILSLGILALAIARLVGIVEVNLPSWVSGVALGMILLDYALLPLVERLIQERDQYRQGRQGEEATAEALRQHLDSRWTLFRNVVLPGDRADIDGVLIGPSGIYALEVKSYRGRFKNQGDEWWWRRYRPGWQRLASNPSRQAKANAARLSEYLHQVVGEKVWVEPRVVWAGPGKLYIQGKPAVYIWFLDNMASYARDLLKSPTKPQTLTQRIREVLIEAVHNEKRK